MSTTLEDCETLIEEYEPEENRINGYLSLQGKKSVSYVCEGGGEGREK